MASGLGIPKVYVINDLESTAYSLGVLGEEDLVELNAGLPPLRETGPSSPPVRAWAKPVCIGTGSVTIPSPVREGIATLEPATRSRQTSCRS